MREEARRRAVDLAARKAALALLRTTYGPLFGSTIKVSALDFSLSRKLLLAEVLQRQSARLPTLSDGELITIWVRFSRYAALTQPAERPGRDRLFLDALAVEWDRRAITPDHERGLFQWPSTLVAELTGMTALDGAWPASGMLDAFGYHVGKTRGLPTNEREQFLQFISEEWLPLVYDRPYTVSWGEFRSPRRLQKMAETLTSLTRNAKRKTAHDYSKAIADWEADLRYLHDAYYISHFHFVWPTAGP